MARLSDATTQTTDIDDRLTHLSISDGQSTTGNTIATGGGGTATDGDRVAPNDAILPSSGGGESATGKNKSTEAGAQPVNNNLPPSVDDLMAIVREFVVRHTNPDMEQGSAGWLADVYRIGASQIPTLEGRNKWSSFEKLMEEHAFGKHFDDPINLRFGTIMEQVIRGFSSAWFETPILGNKISVIKGFKRDSPDGLGVPTPRRYNTLCTTNLREPQITLFEFKCPIRRPIGRTPEHYIPQVMFGADLLGITTRGVLIEGVFRMCELDDMDRLGPHLLLEDQYDLPESEIWACGFLGFAQPEGEEYNLINDAKVIKTLFNRGDLPIYSKVLIKHCERRILDTYTQAVCETTINHLDLLEAFIATLHTRAPNCGYAIVPYKLLQVIPHDIPLEKGYSTRDDKVIEQFMIDLKKIREAPDKVAAYNEWLQERKHKSPKSSHK